MGDDVQVSFDWIASQEGGGERNNESNQFANSGNKSKDVDGLLADELLKMSFVDRNAINEEIHGVRSLAVEETPGLIANSLNSFRMELELLPNQEKQAYLFIQAFRQQPTTATASQTVNFAAYVDDDDFRLRFLRCCLFDVAVAVRRFANYLNFIQTYWGNTFLERPIQLADLNATELKILKRGWTQLLPFRDQSGRRVVVQLSDGRDMENIAFVKVWFYIFDCVSRDSIETQRNGIVSIMDAGLYESTKGDSEPNSFTLKAETGNRFQKLFNGSTWTPLIAAHLAMPTRVVSVHICWPHTPLLKWGLKVYLFHSEMTGSTSALDVNRIRVHSGFETEMRYRVKSYGVPIELLPLTGTNTIKLNYHNQWIKTRRLIENNQNKFQFQNNSAYTPEYKCRFDAKGDSSELITIVECPCSNDVVFRNGTQSMENPGNVIFRNSILSYWEQRERTQSEFAGNNKNSSNNKGKSTAEDDSQDRDFRNQLVRDVEVLRQGNFLEWDKNLNVWVQMTDKIKINRKVGMAFYNCTKRRYTNSIRSNRKGKKQKRIESKSVIKDNGSFSFQFIDKGRSQTLSSGGETFISCDCITSSDDDDSTGKRRCL